MEAKNKSFLEDRADCARDSSSGTGNVIEFCLWLFRSGLPKLDLPQQCYVRKSQVLPREEIDWFLGEEPDIAGRLSPLRYM